MTLPTDPVYGVLWTDDLEEVDREIARSAILCRVKILDPQVMSRVLRRDASVCGTRNEVAFARLRELLMLHLAIREKSAASFGHGLTAAAEDYVIERLRRSFPELEGPWPPR
jgi:L-rhamnose isomerase